MTVGLVFSVFALVFGLSGCQKNGNGLVSGFVTPQGVQAESLLPDESVFVFKWGATDQQQLKDFQNIL